MKNFYEILEVSPAATAAEIKKSYRQLSKKYHPDLSPGDKAAVEKFKKIALAYSVLSDETQRKEYDEKLRGVGKGAKGKEETEFSRSANAGFGTDVNFDLHNVHQHFENFFGFDPVTKEKKDRFAANGQAARDKNPLDTSNIFESFFSPGRKRK